MFAIGDSVVHYFLIGEFVVVSCNGYWTDVLTDTGVILGLPTHALAPVE
jgi:hypothetical protein